MVGPSRAKMLQRQQQLVKIEKLILHGVTNQSEIAAALGVSQCCVTERIKEIHQRWRDSQNEELDVMRAKRIHQFEYIARLALNSYEVSRQDAEEHITVEKECGACNGTGVKPVDIPEERRAKIVERDHGQCVQCGSQVGIDIDHIIPLSRGGSGRDDNLQLLCGRCVAAKREALGLVVRCPTCEGVGLTEDMPGEIRRCVACRGTGEQPDLPKCGECGGRGRLVITTTKTRGQAGDSSFLSVARMSIESAAKLEGFCPRRQGPGGGMTLHQTIREETRGVGGELETRVQELYVDAPSDLLIQCKVALEKLRGGLKDGTVKRVIETEAITHHDDEGDDNESDSEESGSDE